MEGLNQTAKAPHTHKVSLLGRKTCALNGVVDVLAFDVNEIILETEQGMLMIRGSALHVTRLTLEKGEIEIDGKIPKNISQKTSRKTGQFSQKSILCQNIYKLNREIP